MRNNDVVEVVAFHALTLCSPVLCAIFVGGCVAFQSKSSSGKKLGNGDRVETKGPRFSQLRDIAKELPHSFKANGTVQSSGMYVSEDDPAGRSATGHISKHGVHSLGGEVVGDPFPQEQRRERRTKSGSRQKLRQFVAIEVGPHVTDVSRELGKQAP